MISDTHVPTENISHISLFKSLLLTAINILQKHIFIQPSGKKNIFLYLKE